MNKIIVGRSALGCAERSIGQASISQTSVKFIERHHTRTHLINMILFGPCEPCPRANLISESVKDAKYFHAAAPEGGESARFFARLAQAVRPGWLEQKEKPRRGDTIVPYSAFSMVKNYL